MEEKYGMLTIIKEVDPYISPTGGKHRMVLCLCECGREKILSLEKIKAGKTKSCGCLRKAPRERCPWHDVINTRIYTIWSNMNTRCNNRSVKAYKNYGGRGITVCEEWHRFEPFYKWAVSSGYDNSLFLDRIDNDKGYSPENCRWVNAYVQGNNKRTNRKITYNGETHTKAEWASILNVSYKALSGRIERGWSVERAFSQPYRKSHNS